MAENKNQIQNNPIEATHHINILEQNYDFDDLNDIPRETIMNIYGEDFENLTSLINEEEMKVKDYFISIQNKLKEKFSTFKNKLNSHLKHVTNKIANSFNLENNIDIINNNNQAQAHNKEKEKSLLIQKYSKDYIKRIENIIDTQRQIMKSIKETMNIFFNFFDISNSLDKEKPIHDFINKEFKNIINSWLFLKLNLDKFDLAQALNNSGLNLNLKNVIMRICEGKNFVMNISLPKDYLSDVYFRNITFKNKEKFINEKNKNKKILKENYINLVKLKMNNISYFDTYFDEINSFDNMKSLKLKNVSFKSNNVEILKNFPNLNKLYINNSKNLDIQILQNLSQNLTSLTLSNNDLVDFEFNTIMNDYLKKSNSLRNNLEYLSFSNNNLSYINLNDIIDQKSSFFALKKMDFSKNSIYKFDIPFEYFPEIKFINLCYNNFSRNYFNNINKDIFVLLNGNMFLSNFNLANNYFNDIKVKLNKYPTKLIYLNLSFIPNLISNEYFAKLEINDTILLGLKKINFSYNNITNEAFFEFIKNNKGLLNLKSLNLKGNKINDLFLEEYLNLKLNYKFTKLKKINLDENLLGNDEVAISPLQEEGDNENLGQKIYKIRLLYKFITENKSLIQMSITKNNIFQTFKIFNVYQNCENNFKVDRKGKIIINCLNSFLLRIKKELLLKSDEGQNDYNRNKFNLKFDCNSDNDLNSENFTSNNNWL